jgi:hypothetical protein
LNASVEVTPIYALRNMVERCFNKLKNAGGWQPATIKPPTVTSASSTPEGTSTLTTLLRYPTSA